MQVPKTARKPTYVILFDSTQSRDESYTPYISQDEFVDGAHLVTAPHGLSVELIPCLRALWFCLHLPATAYDLLDLQARYIRSFQQYDMAHEIVLLPNTILDEASNIIRRREPIGVPVLVFAPDSLISEANDLAERLGVPNRPILFSELDPQTIPQLWRVIHQMLLEDSKYLERDFDFVNRLDLAPLLLPNAFLLRQLGTRRTDEPINLEELSDLTYSVLNDHAVTSAVARCENAGMNEVEAEKVLKEVIDEERQNVSLPISVIVPGVAPAYVKKATALGVPMAPHASNPIDRLLLWSDSDSFDQERIEKSTINFIATHRAIARGGMAIVTEAVRPSLFHLLNNLERHYIESPPNKRQHIWRSLREIGAAVADMFDAASKGVLEHASFANVFSNFPIGLAILPGNTAPYCCQVPIAYRPLAPLTRTLQSELANPPMILWGQELSVLIVECIEATDPVGQVSRETWAHIRDLYENHPTIHISCV